MLSHLHCVQLFMTLWTVAWQALLFMGFSRQEYWSGLPCPSTGHLPNAGIKPVSLASPTLQADSLPIEPPSKPQLQLKMVDVYTIAVFKWSLKLIISNPDPVYKSELKESYFLYKISPRFLKSNCLYIYIGNYIYYIYIIYIYFFLKSN